MTGTTTNSNHHMDQGTTDTTMDSHLYSIPKGVHVIPTHELDLRPDSEVDAVLLNPTPPSSSSEKNIWLFWHSGYSTMHPYTQRTVRTYHRRFSPKGWTVRVVDRAAGSPCNVANYLDIEDPDTFPKAFREGTITGTYALQHTSDLVRWPLLLKYGGVYVDVGLMPIGDLDRLWSATVGDPNSPWEILSNNAGGPDDYDLTNYFLCAGRDNAVFQRCHRLLLALWAEDGGKTSTEGMWKSPLLRGLPLLGQSLSDQDSRDLTDYIIQGQVMRMVLALVDEEDGWNGPEYVTRHIYSLEYMVGSQLINEMTAWDGPKAFELMSLKLPEPGVPETEDQRLAREIVEACLSRSFSFKLAHGIIVRVVGETLGSLWKANQGSDNVPGTYAHWLRYGMLYWSQDDLPERLEYVKITPFKTGPLLRVE